MGTPSFDMGLFDADSLLYSAGHLCEKKVWNVYYNGEEVEEFTAKSDLNKWLKDEHNLSSRKFEKEVTDEGIEIHRLDGWELEGVPKLEPVHYGYKILKTCIESTWKHSGAKNILMYLSGGRNFRYDIYSQYKEDRANRPKPKYYDELRDYVLDKYDCVENTIIEADDAVCIDYNDMHRSGIKPIILHIDKDIDQFPGYHYNWDWRIIVGKNPHYYVSKDEGRRSFFMQMLTGDNADCIPGIKGVGNTTAAKMLGGTTDLDEYINRVKDAYAQFWVDEDHEAIFERNALLLFMLREPFTSIEDIDWRKYV